MLIRASVVASFLSCFTCRAGMDTHALEHALYIHCQLSGTLQAKVLFRLHDWLQGKGKIYPKICNQTQLSQSYRKHSLYIGSHFLQV